MMMSEISQSISGVVCSLSAPPTTMRPSLVKQPTVCYHLPFVYSIAAAAAAAAADDDDGCWM